MTKGVACLLRPQVTVDGGTHRSDSGSNAPEDLRRLRGHTGEKSKSRFFVLLVWEIPAMKEFGFMARISKRIGLPRQWLELSHGKPKGTIPQTSE